MKCSSWLRRGPGIRLHSVWFSTVMFVGAAVFLGFFGLSIRAAAPTLIESKVAEPSALTVLGVPRPVPAEAGAGMQPTRASTETVFLPLIARNYYWKAPDSLLGVQMFADHREQELVVLMDQAGARWIRVPFFWAQYEPQNTTPGNYHWWIDFEDWLARLSAQNIKVILTLAGNPSWAATYPGGPIDKVPVGELAQFMQAVVARWSAPPMNVKYWEFYNEPDNGSRIYAERGWGYWGHVPAQYAAMLAAVYPRMKTADPEAQIVFGGIAYDNFTTTGGPFVPDFLDRVLQSGGGAHFDVMNFHYYSVFQRIWDPYGPGIIGKTRYLQNKLAEYDVYKPFVCTETSMWSDAANGSSHEEQSRQLVKVFVRSMTIDLKATIWFKLIDDAGVGALKYGLLGTNLSPKPSYYAFSTVARQLASAESVGPLGLSETGSGDIEAYEFLATDGLIRIVVAWSNDDLNHAMSLTAGCLLVVDKYGGERQVCDEHDGVVDGRVEVSVGPSPVYLRLAVDTSN